MKYGWIVALLLSLSACRDNTELRLNTQINALKRRIETLEVQRDILESQLAVKANQRPALQAAVDTYVRRCRQAVQAVQAAAGTAGLPPGLDGVGCSDKALGDLAPPLSTWIQSSLILALPGSAEGYRIQAESIGGERASYPQ